MNIVYLCREYPPFPHGGIGTVTQSLARSMVDRGHKVTVIGVYSEITSEQIEEDHGVNVIRLGAAQLPVLNFIDNSWRLYKRLCELHKQLPIDVVEGQEAVFAFLPVSLPGKKIIRMHGGHHFFFTTLGQSPRFWRSWQEKRSFAKADVLCAVSRFVAETTNRLLHQEDRPVEIIPNPVDTDFFRPHPEVSVVKDLIVFVGTLCEKKGVRQLLQAFPEIARAFPNAKLLLIGRDTSLSSGKSYRSTLQADIQEPLAEKIEFRGAVDHRELPLIYASAAVCVFPSHMESQGLVILEAMAVGKAVVASKAGPGPELIDHEEDGLLCDPKDPASIAAAVNRLLSEDDTRRYFGVHARQKVVKLFSNEVIIDKNESLYRSSVAPI